MTTDRSDPIGAKDVHAHCLMCGARNPSSLGLHFEDGEDGAIRARFRPGRALQGYAGILHGGMVAALLDAAMTHCLFRRGIEAVTADLHVRFLRPIRCGSFVDLRGWITAESPRLYALRAELARGKQVVAWAEAKFLRR